ncbi:MAG: hypothetical protein V4555_21550 [Acidobacteriota bacterium]
MPRIIATIFAIAVLAFLPAIFFAKSWLAQKNPALPRWRNAAFHLAYIAVVAQFVTLAILVAHVNADIHFFFLWLKVLPNLFVLALASILTGRGLARRWLLASSIFVFAVSFLMCFFIPLSA